MKYKVLGIPQDAVAIFKDRPNRFLGVVDILEPSDLKHSNVNVHIRDPGRLKELLYYGNKVLLKKCRGSNRKTEWEIIAADFEGSWILINSGFHRKIAEAVLKTKKINPFGGIKCFKPEVKFNNSRFDFLITTFGNQKHWLEVKGCTLAESGVAKFPDAPTKRGKKHLDELIKAKAGGDSASLLILTFRKDANCFLPNFETDPVFSDTFFKAKEAGVKIHILKFSYENDNVYFIKKIPVCNKKV